MILTTHQPIFLPWPGFFVKALHADVMVLLDDVQFPRGRSWMTRNRLKSHQGELWLRVPVWKKRRGLQIIRHVEICDETDWRPKHLRSISELYTHAPYQKEYFPELLSIYEQRHTRLSLMNIAVVRFLWNSLGIKTPLLLQSEIGITGKGSELLISLCQKIGADCYSTLAPVEKYLDMEMFQSHRISVQLIRFVPPVYPQLWGDFRFNLSALDLLLNCGPKSLEILKNSAPHQ